MGPRILYELSQEVCVLIEKGLRQHGEGRVPVFFCHPLDSLEGQRDPAGEGTFGILYLTRVVPDLSFRQSGFEVSPGGADSQRQQLRRPPLWVRVRYVFLVAGGDVEAQLVAIAAVLATLHDHQSIRLAAGGGALAGTAAPGQPGGDADRGHTRGGISCPLGLVDDGESWRDLGLPEHRLALSFEVTCPVASTHVETVGRIRERDLSVEERAS